MQRECDNIRKKEYKIYDRHQRETVEALDRYRSEGKNEGRKYKNMKELADAISRFQGQTVSQQRVSEWLKQTDAIAYKTNSKRTGEIIVSENQGGEQQNSPSPACSLKTTTIESTDDEEFWVKEYTHSRITRYAQFAPITRLH